MVAYGFDDQVFEFHGSRPARDSKMFFNRRAEVWGLMRDALTAVWKFPMILSSRLI